MVVKGTIPGWAAGALYRTGPGQSCVKDTVKGTHYVSHWFDGFAQTHRFDIIPPTSSSDKSATVTYSSLRQSKDFVEIVKKKGMRPTMSFGQKADPCMGIFAKFMSAFDHSYGDNNVTVQANISGIPSKAPGAGHRHGIDNLFLGTDHATIQQINPATLEPLGLAQQDMLHPSLKGPLSCAHAQQDPETGDWFNYNLAFGLLQVTYRVFRVNAASGKTDILATIAEPDIKPAYLHSFFLTQNYVVLCIPSTHLGWNGAKVPLERNIVDAIQPFNKSKLCQWIVVDRRHGQGVVARFTTPAGFFFHSINAFEECVDGDEPGTTHTELCLDSLMYDNFDIITSFYYDVILDRDEAMKKYWSKDNRYQRLNARFARYRFRMPSTPSPKKVLSATEDLTIPSPHAGELPTINRSYATKNYRYVYSTPTRGLSTVVDALAKTDLYAREALLWSGPKGHSPGEPIFVARPGATEEDDGVILSVVVDGNAESSYLLCLDARTMEEMGRAEADFAVGMGFHGMHAPIV